MVLVGHVFCINIVQECNCVLVKNKFNVCLFKKEGDQRLKGENL